MNPVFNVFHSRRLPRCLDARQILSHLRTPLFQNGYALILSSTATSGLGLLYWVLAARAYSAETVGLNSAILSAMLFLSAVAQLNLGSVMLRFVPLAGGATRRLVALTYVASIVATIALAAVFVLGIDLWSPTLRVLNQDTQLLAWFLLATMAWCIFTLQDSVLTALRRTLWVPVENTIFAIAKIGLLMALAVSFPKQGIFASWTIPVLAALVPVNLFIFWRAIPQHVRDTAGRAVPLDARRLIRFASGNYVGSIFFQASATLLPILVADRAGATANAYFYLPWTITSSLQMIALNMSTSFTVEASHDEGKLAWYCSRVLAHNLRMLLPLVAVLVLGAPWVLGLFGANYAAQGTDVLRLLALSVIPYSMTALYVALARVQNRVNRIALVHAVRCLAVLALSYWVLPYLNITGVGWIWLGTETLIGGFLLLTQLRPFVQNREGAPGWHQAQP